MDDYGNTPAPAPSNGLSSSDALELAQRRAEERRQMQARIDALEESERQNQARIDALEAVLGSDDDATTPKSPKGLNSPNGGGAVKPKAPAAPGAQQKIQRRFL